MIGNRRAKRHAPSCSTSFTQAGFTYLWLILMVAIGSAGGLVLVEVWQTQVQRSKAQEQTFRLDQYESALQSYASVTPVGKPCLPTALEELLEDRRSSAIKRHLRRLYTDPYSGKLDWALARGPGGVITEVRSPRDEETLLAGQGVLGSPDANGVEGHLASRAAAKALERCPRSQMVNRAKTVR